MAGRKPASARLAHIPALDGLRGVAVAGVLLFHGGVGWAGGGFLGVSTFFTLSGFLITSLLVLEYEQTGRIHLRAFWSGRARRLLPAALVALVGIAAYAAFVATGSDARRIGTDGLSALGYVANWRFLFAGQSYAALFQTPSPVQHFWSLAIEEQFYLVFPLIMVVLLPRLTTRRGLRVALGLLAVASAGLAWLLWAPGQDPSRLYYGTDARAVELLIGAVLATRIAGRRRVRVRARRVRTATYGAVALVGLAVLWTSVDQSADFLYRGGLPLNAALTAMVIAATIVPGPVRALLGWRPLRALGLVSYGVYLYHWPIFLWLDAERTGLGGAPLLALRLAVTMAAAVASYHFLEQPVRSGRRVIPRRPQAVVPALAAAVASVLLLAPTLAPEAPGIDFSAVRRTGSDARATSTPTLDANATARNSELSSALVANGTPTLPLTGPGTGSATPGGRLMVAGDSIALTLGRGIERWGTANGVAVLNSGRIWCPIARGGRLAASLGRSVDGCSDWPTLWGDQARTFQPDTVLVLTPVWDLSPRERDQWGRGFLQAGDRRFDDYIRSEWAKAVRLFRDDGARVVWLIPGCALDPKVDEALTYAKRHYFGAVRAAGATTLDLGPLLCPGGRFVNSVDGVDDVRPDGSHFSDPGADAVAGWLGRRIGEPPATRP